MKMQRLFSFLFLAGALLVGASAPSAVSANTEQISAPLPLPKADDTLTKDIPLLIEQDSEAVVLDEKHRQIGKVKTAKNVTSQQTAAAAKKLTATVMAVADEEFRSKHPKDWKKRISDTLEKADNAFEKKHQIDLQIKAYGKTTKVSDPHSSRFL